jgi:hypothetical protein
MTITPDYKNKILTALTEALFKASVIEASDGTKAAVFMSGEILDAVLTIASTMLATSPSAASPTALRKFCDEFAKRLYRRTKAAQENPDINELFAQRYSYDPGRIS